MPFPFARYLSLILLAAAFVLPYAVTIHTYPIPTFYAEFTALILYLFTGAAIVLLLSNTRSRIAFTLPPIALVPLLFGVLLIAQSFVLSIKQPSMNWLGGAFLLVALMVVYTGYGFACAHLTEIALHWVGHALLVGGLFAVFCQIVQLFHLEMKLTPFVVIYNIAIERRPFGNMAQANHLATYITFAMAAALYFVQTQRLHAPIWALLSIIYSIGLALTVSRGPWLQMGIIVMAGFWMSFIKTKHHHPTWTRWHNTREWLIPALLVILFIAINAAVRWANIFYNLKLGESAADRFRDASQITPRIALWKYGWMMFKTHPLLGVGWGEFPNYQYKLVKVLGSVEIANNSHNIFIDLLAKTGLIGFSIVVIGLISWFMRIVRAPHSSITVFGVTLISLFMIHALVEYPQQYTFFLLPTMFIFGLLETKSLRLLPEKITLNTYALIVFGGLNALYPIFRDYTRVEALYYNIHSVEQYCAHPSFLFSAWGAYGLTTLLPIDNVNLPIKLAMHQQALTLLPSTTVLRRYAILQALNGDTVAALDTVERLKIFTEKPRNWPSQLTFLYALCDKEALLKNFKTELMKRYGTSLPSINSRDESNTK